MRYHIVKILSIFIFLTGCQNDKKTILLLQSKEPENIITGAYNAGESGNQKFVPYLLSNAYDIRSCTNIRFKGFTVYQEKMIALQKIFKRDPPIKITFDPDSAVIKFYMELASRNRAE